MHDQQVFDESERNYLAGEPLSQIQLACMDESLGSENLRVRVIGCGALLRSQCATESQKDKARCILCWLCDNAHSLNIITKTELSVALLVIPFQEVNNFRVKLFMTSFVKSEHPTHRANAVLLLARLAQHGDIDCMPLIREASHDTDGIVKANAERILGMLG